MENTRFFEFLCVKFICDFNISFLLLLAKWLFVFMYDSVCLKLILEIPLLPVF